MKLLTATAISITLSMPASAAAQAERPQAGTRAGAPQMEIYRSGSRPPVTGSAANFTGVVRVEPVFDANASSAVSAALVTFAPGARSAWHSHPKGQRLIVTEGVGWTQMVGGPVEEARAGDVVWCPPGIKHWHGATPGSSMTHYAIQEAVDGTPVQWMEHVTDAEYRR
jgi:quercetin dioxygenase-like cupin family protein